MLRILFQKMFSNRWMVLCLLIGSILIVAMVSSIPVYSYGILQRMLTRDLENFQVDTDIFPGRYTLTSGVTNYGVGATDATKTYYRLDGIVEKMAGEIGLPVSSSVRSLSIDYLVGYPEEQKEVYPKERYLKLEAMTAFQDHISITNGRMFSSVKDGDVFETVVTAKAMEKLDLRLNETYTIHGLSLNDRENVLFKVKIVGVFAPESLQDLYWYESFLEYNSSFFIDSTLFIESFMKNMEANKLRQVDMEWQYAFDYHNITLENIESILAAYETQSDTIKAIKGSGTTMDFDMVCIPTLEEYNERHKQLNITLWILQVPILLMLAFYIFMVSQLIIKYEEDEIAVLKSRGANNVQVFSTYFIESLVLSVAALIIGPPLGLLMCRIIGSANGFLEFVQRTALPTQLSFEAYLYSSIAVLFFIITMLIPAVIAARTTIVLHKQKKSRQSKAGLWQRYYLDILLVAISLYGLYSYSEKKITLVKAGISGKDLAVDPLLFLICTFFILGMGLLFLRLYPYLIKLIYWIGKRMWPPVLYSSFIQVARSGGHEQFLMLFIILTLSVGIFNANSARTINRNMEDKIVYDIGADAVMQSKWSSNKDFGMLSGMEDSGGQSNDPIIYKEPSYDEFTELEGAETVTKVFRRDEVQVQVGGSSWDKTYLMGINPYEFGRVSYVRNDLLPFHYHEYLNLMTESQTAFLVSNTLKEKYKLKAGDRITVKWRDQDSLEGIIFAFIDYWPTYNPNPPLRDDDNNPFNFSKEDYQVKNLIVANLSYIQAKTYLEPYEVWIKKKPNVTDAELYNEMKDMDIKISYIDFIDNETIKKRNDPMLQGTNGVLTMGFIISMIVCMVGFIIYWIISIRKRILQFGILRAIGLSMRKILGMLLCEQILISGTAVILGIIIGGLTSSYFVPLLQLAQSTEELVLPFKITAQGGDYIKLYIVVGAMLTAGCAMLGVFVSRIKIHQALKLGED